MKLTRERKEQTGAFYTPKVWADLAVKYILAILPYPEHYTYYDPAAGEGALLDALPAHFNKIASTLEAEDVEILKAKGYKNAFQFDFLDEPIGGLELNSSSPMLEVLKQREKLIIFTNPPYNHLPASNKSFAKLKYKENKALNLFFYRIIYELKPMMLCSFNKMDIWQGGECVEFRKKFNPYNYLVRGLNIPKKQFSNKEEWADFYKEELQAEEFGDSDYETYQNYSTKISNGLFITPSDSWPGLKGNFGIAFNMFWVGDGHEFADESKKKLPQKPELTNCCNYANLQEFINAEFDDTFDNQLIVLTILEIKYKSGEINENIVLLCSNRPRVVYGENGVKERYYKHYSTPKQELPPAALKELQQLIFEGSKRDFANAHECKHWLFCQTGINWITFAIADVTW